jgi:hypothetical protein
MNEETHPTGWTKLWHPRGPQVTIPLVMPADEMLQAVNSLLDQGWLVTAPGLEEGEEKEQVAYVLRSTYESEKGTTPVVLLYAANDTMKWSFLKVYLNRREDVQAFEHASGLVLANMPEYVGNDKPQRGAAQKTDRFIIAAPKPFGVVFKRNPKHDDTEAGKKKPARLFVRWEKSLPKAEGPDYNQQPAPPDATPEEQEWNSFFAERPDLEFLNRTMRTTWANLPKGAMRTSVWHKAQQYASEVGFEYDPAAAKFVQPVMADPPY